MTYRSLLFVPGDRPDRFEKAIASGADAVCIDLEDAVHTTKKDAAREAVRQYFTELIDNVPDKRDVGIGVRINSLRTFDGCRDVLFLSEFVSRLSFVMLPKIRNATEIHQIQDLFASATPSIWSLIETPDGIRQTREIAEAIGPDGGLLFGGADLSASLGCDLSWDALYHARSSIVLEAANVGCDVMDVPWLNVPAIDEMIEETKRVQKIGFTGRASIHPSHVSGINSVFTPSETEVKRAQEVIAAYDRAGAVLLVDGKLVEKPILAAAKRVLAAYKAASSRK